MCVFLRVSSVVTKKTMSSTNVKIGSRVVKLMQTIMIIIGPPKLEDDHFETWKKYLKILCKITDITEEKRALAVHLTLSGKARAATSELSVEDLEKKNGIDILLTKLDDIFLVDKGSRQFTAYHELHNYLRSRDTDIDKFVRV